MIDNTNFFYDDALNIFTDASMTKTNNGETIGCYGFVPVKGIKDNFEIILEPIIGISRHSTNNDSELRAILAGIFFAIEQRNNFKQINLFSDSKISVFGIREWIYNWMRNSRNGIMYSTAGEVLNQELIKDIVFTILNYNLNINIFHQKGHVDIDNYSKITKAQNVFNQSNGLNMDINFIEIISLYNDMIDNFTRDRLLEFVSNNVEDKQKLSRAICFDISKFDADIYKELIGGIKK